MHQKHYAFTVTFLVSSINMFLTSGVNIFVHLLCREKHFEAYGNAGKAKKKSYLYNSTP
jgi:hypothetical protein